MYPWVKESHIIFRGVLLVQWIISLFIAAITGEWLPAFLFALPIILVPLWLTWSFPQALISRYAVAIAVQLMTALHIHQAYGQTELHFEIFVMLAFLANYRDWRVIAVSTAVVAVHHVVFFVLQVQGAPVFIFEEGHATLSILVIHALFALAEGAVLMVMTKRMFTEGVAAESLTRTVAAIIKHPEKIDLTVNSTGKAATIKAFNGLISQIRELVVNNIALTEIATSAVEQEAASQSIAQSTANMYALVQEEVKATGELAQQVAALSQGCEGMQQAIGRFSV